MEGPEAASPEDAALLYHSAAANVGVESAQVFLVWVVMSCLSQPACDRWLEMRCADYRSMNGSAAEVIDYVRKADD